MCVLSRGRGKGFDGDGGGPTSHRFDAKTNKASRNCCLPRIARLICVTAYIPPLSYPPLPPPLLLPPFQVDLSLCTTINNKPLIAHSKTKARRGQSGCRGGKMTKGRRKMMRKREVKVEGGWVATREWGNEF